MTEAEKIAEFLAKRGVTKCPPRWGTETSNAIAEPPPSADKKHRNRGLGKRLRKEWAYKLNKV